MADFNDYKILLNSAPENERYYELLILSHSEMSKTYYLVIDSRELIALSGLVFEPANINPSAPISSNDLDQSSSFTIGDVYNILDAELDNIALDTEEKILCRSLFVLSTDLDTPMRDTTFYADSIPQSQGVFTIKSSVTDLNSQTTGEVMNLTNLPSLGGI